MNEIKQILAFLKEYLTYIVLLVYLVSFSNFYFYYKSFNIPVFNYVGINDLLFFSIEYIFKLVLIILVYEFIIFVLFAMIYTFIYEKIILIKKGKLKKYLIAPKKYKEKIKSVLNLKFSPSLIQFKLVIAFLGIFIIAFLPHKLVILPAFFVYFIYLIEKASNERMLIFTIPFSLIIVIIFMMISTMHSAYEKRYEKDDFIISFKEDSKYISTEKEKGCLNYLGETSSHIFLYDIEYKTSRIYSKSNLTEIQIKDTGTLDKIVLKLKRNKFVKFLTEIFIRK